MLSLGPFSLACKSCRNSPAQDQQRMFRAELKRMMSEKSFLVLSSGPPLHSLKSQSAGILQFIAAFLGSFPLLQEAHHLRPQCEEFLTGAKGVRRKEFGKNVTEASEKVTKTRPKLKKRNRTPSADLVLRHPEFHYAGECTQRTYGSLPPQLQVSRSSPFIGSTLRQGIALACSSSKRSKGGQSLVCFLKRDHQLKYLDHP